MMAMGYYEARLAPLIGAVERVGAHEALDGDVNWVANGDRGIKHISISYQASYCGAFSPRKSARSFQTSIRSVLADGQGCVECMGRILEARAGGNNRGRELTVSLLVDAELLREALARRVGVIDAVGSSEMATQFANRLTSLLDQARDGAVEVEPDCQAIISDLRDEFIEDARTRTAELRSQGDQLHVRAVSELMEAEGSVPDWVATPAERTLLGWRSPYMRDHYAATAYTSWWTATTVELVDVELARASAVDGLTRYGLQQLSQLETISTEALKSALDEVPDESGEVLASLVGTWRVHARDVAAQMVARWEERLARFREQSALVSAAVCTVGGVSSAMALVPTALAVGTRIQVQGPDRSVKTVVEVSGATLERLSQFSSIPGSAWASVFVAPVPGPASDAILETALTLWDPYTEGEFAEFSAAFASASALLDHGRKITLARPPATAAPARSR